MATGLATRCPACGTVFRVVLDQLRVSDGWVRCGRCSDVFDASQALVDLESGETRRIAFDTTSAPAEATSAASVAPPTPASSAEQEERPAAFETTAVIERVDPPFEDDPIAERQPPDDTARRALAGEGSSGPLTAEPAVDLPGDSSAADSEADDRLATPSFVRRAEQAQRWRQPRVRAMLAGSSALAALVLALQITHAYRDRLAANAPGLRGALVAACQVLGCSVGPPRALEQVSVESSGLVRVEKSNLYRLAVALRNRADHDVALPALEVTVSDGQGKLLARRVLLAAEMGSGQTSLAAGRDVLLQATLQITTEPLAGYTVELFYP
ncbi:MAG TPA: zinc-ribbon and DUF3426 domain-containing protein [Rubrivivax sp.]|nr:zinc-ribbon and DUF3426 domain-containing protein [Rubrivivax sp.]